MLTVIETKAFIRNMEGVWQDAERQEFINWIAATPDAGDLVVGTGGLRKVRWSRQGMGKRGGVRVVTYEVRSDGVVWLLIGYTKAKFDNLPTDFLNALKQEIQNEDPH